MDQTKKIEVTPASEHMTTDHPARADLPVFSYPPLEGERASELENLIALDLETAGRDERSDQVFEIHARSGMIAGALFVPCAMQYGDIRVGGSYTNTLPLLLSTHLHDMHPAVVDMHSKNGLLAEAHALLAAMIRKDPNHPSRATALTSQYFDEVDAHLAQLFPVLPEGRKWTLLGNTVHFDLRFVRHVFPRFAKGLSHRVFDVSTVRMFCEALGMPYMEGDPAHRATADVDSSIKFLRKYADFCLTNQF